MPTKIKPLSVELTPAELHILSNVVDQTLIAMEENESVYNDPKRIPYRKQLTELMSKLLSVYFSTH